jgi:O-acetyl-ADP-ribose deacetylase (regulator of RNase III)
MADCQNVHSIIEKGILCRNRMVAEEVDFADTLADQDFIKRRQNWLVPLTRKFLFDYTRLFVNPKNPMMYRRKDKLEDIALIEISSEIFWDENTLITDGNAQSERTKFLYARRFVESVDASHNFLDYEVLLKEHGSQISNHIIRRKKMAEVLVEGHVKPEMISKIILPNHKWHEYFAYHFPESKIPFEVGSDLYLDQNIKTGDENDRIKIIRGHLFTTECQSIVNSVNCEGVMGAGIALYYKFRYPEMFKEYQIQCKKGNIAIGKLWMYSALDGKTIISFPSKDKWRNPSEYSYLEAGLQEFVKIYKKKNITSVAFPVLGASKGGLSEASVLDLMKRYLSKCDILVEIYLFDKSQKDDMIGDFKESIIRHSTDEICEHTRIRRSMIESVKAAFERKPLNNMLSLLEIEGIGPKTLEKLIEFYRAPPTDWFS